MRFSKKIQLQWYTILLKEKQPIYKKGIFYCQTRKGFFNYQRGKMEKKTREEIIYTIQQVIKLRER